MRQKAQRENPLSSRDAVDTVRQDMPVAARIKASPSGQRKIYTRARRKHEERVGDRELDNADPLAIVIPPALAENVIHNGFINIEGIDRKILIFATNASLRWLARFQNEIAIDGTFKVSLFEYMF